MNARMFDAPHSLAGAPLAVIPVFAGDTGLHERVGALVGDALVAAASRAFALGDAGGAASKSTVLLGGDGEPERLLLLGAGGREEFDAESVRRFAGRAVRAAERLGVTALIIRVEDGAGLGSSRLVQSATEGASLASWGFRELRAPVGDDDEDLPEKAVEQVDIWIDDDGEEAAEGLRVGNAIAEGQRFARDLQSRPGNVATPSHLGVEAMRVASDLGMTVHVLGPDKLEAENMHALLSVARGSDQEPRLIVLEHWGGDGSGPLALVGKGLTFDAGGISLKPPAGMEDMKFDMSGGAAVLGAMVAIARLDLPIDVVGVVPSSENLVSGKAMKPGDVIRTRAGKTVEVVNTDAEGRLILCDALDYTIDHYEPSAVVDLATLTGAVVVGLGHHAAAVLGTDDALVQELRDAGDAAGERCWPLPLWKEYRKQLKSVTADMMNVGGRPAGTITAAWFLREFVGDAAWAHLDIAGTAYGKEPLPYQRKGGFGFPTRLLVEWVRRRAE